MGERCDCAVASVAVAVDISGRVMLSSVTSPGVTSASVDSVTMTLATFSCVMFACDDESVVEDSAIVATVFDVAVSSAVSEDVNSDCEIVHTDQVVPASSMSRNIANNQPAVLVRSALTW